VARIPGVTHHVGKGATEELLPHRTALTTLAKGQHTLSQYAKLTPSGAGGLGSKSILGMSPPDTSGDMS
jgi:hypothetical protein